jgi:hypothetical protein
MCEMMVAMSVHRTLAALLGVALLTGACSGSHDPATAPSGTTGTSLSLEVASSDLAIGAPQHFELGIFSGDGQGVKLLAFGRISFAFSFLGDGSGSPVPGPTATGTYVAAFGMPQSGPAPAFTDPNDARGVYQADVEFDRAGTWQVDATVDLPSIGTRTLSTPFIVSEKHSLPAPGDRAQRTENLTIDSKGVPPAAIDSRALDGAPVPDPELHRTTIADALMQHRPILAIFSTPTFCVSLMCGPETDGLEALAKRYQDRAVFIHVEIWRNYQKSIVNKAAADWVCCNETGDLTEPWLFLIGPDGVIKDRWGPLFDPAEVAKELAQLPRSKP